MLTNDNDLISVKNFVFKEAKEVLYENKKNEIKMLIKFFSFNLYNRNEKRAHYNLIFSKKNSFHNHN